MDHRNTQQCKLRKYITFPKKEKTTKTIMQKGIEDERKYTKLTETNKNGCAV